MSFYDQQTSELAQAQVKEAVSRMKMLKLHGNVIKDFMESGRLNLSERGILFWLNKKEQQMVDEWQKTTGNMVYHVIKNNMEFGLCYSFLYVSKHEEEWNYDREYLMEGYPFVCVVNADDVRSSEFGSIGIRPLFGGLLRTA